jgi:hypothetical protein
MIRERQEVAMKTVAALIAISLSIVSGSPFAQGFCDSVSDGLLRFQWQSQDYKTYQVIERDWDYLHIKLIRPGDSIDLRLSPGTADMGYDEVQALTKSIFLVLTGKETAATAMKRRMMWCKKY